MRDRNDPNFVGRNVIEDAVRKTPKEIATPRFPKDRADIWIAQYVVYCPLELGNEGQAQLSVGARRVKGSGIAQLAEGERNND